MASGIKPTALSTRTATIILAALAIIIGIYPLVARPDLVRAGVFLFLDEGHALLSATIINGGGHLYRDLYTPYGPLPAWMWAGIARVAGNTPTAFGVMHVFFNTATLLLVFGTLRRTLTPAWALAFAVVCVLPSVIIRGQIFGGMWVNTYVTVERAVIAGLLFAWRPPIERSFARSFVLGALLGTLQWIKFGTVAFIGAGFVAAEAWSLWSDGRTRAAWRQVGMALVAAAFVEGLMVAWAVASLPWPMARDVIWPSFGVRMYQTPTLAPRYPPLAPQVFFFRRDVGVTCGVVLGAILLWRERRARSAPMVVWLLAAYVAACIALFRHVYHYYGYAWLLTTLVGLTMAQRSSRFRVGTLLFCAPVVFFTLRSMLLSPAPGEWITTPQSGPLYVTSEAAEDVRAINALADTEATRGGQVLAGGAMSGWYAAYGHTPLYRQVWLLPGFVRPWEAADAERAWSRATVLAVCGRDDGSLGTLALDPDVEGFLAHTFPVAQPLTRRCTAYTRPPS